jgi:hypothetical protein
VHFSLPVDRAASRHGRLENEQNLSGEQAPCPYFAYFQGAEWLPDNQSIGNCETHFQETENSEKHLKIM